MELSSRIRLSAYLSIGILIIISPALYWCYLNIQKATNNDILADSIQESILKRALIRDEYLLYHEKVSKNEWIKKNKDGELLFKKAILQFEDKEQLQYVEELMFVVADSTELFSRITSENGVSESGTEKNNIFKEAEKRLVSQLLLNDAECQRMSTHLRSLSREHLDSSYRFAIAITLGFVVVTACFTTLNSWSISFLLRMRKEAEVALQNSYNNLEYQVHERTLELNDANEKLKVEAYKLNSTFEELSKVTDELSIIFDNVPAMIWFKDDKNNVIRANNSAAMLIGRKVEEVIGHSSEEIFPEEATKFYTDDLEVIVSGQPKMGIVEPVTDKNGGIRWLSTDKLPIGDSSGNVTGVLVFALDITERKLAEEALRVADVKLRQNLERQSVTLQAVGDGIIAVDSNGRIELLNPVAEQLTGWAQAEAIGRPLDEVFHIISEITGAPVENPVAKVLSRGVVIGLANHTLLITKGGSKIPIADSAAPIFGSSGEIVGVVLVFRDQTEERKTTRALEESAEKAMMLAEQSRAANKAKSEFLANMSHEIRTPLNGVLGMLQLLETTDPNEEQKEYILGAIQSTNRLTRLLCDILDISRIEAGKMQIVETEFNIKQTRDSIKELFALEAKGKGLRLEFGRDEDLPLVLIGDDGLP